MDEPINVSQPVVTCKTDRCFMSIPRRWTTQSSSTFCAFKHLENGCHCHDGKYLLRTTRSLLAKLPVTCHKECNGSPISQRNDRADTEASSLLEYGAAGGGRQPLKEMLVLKQNLFRLSDNIMSLLDQLTSFGRLRYEINDNHYLGNNWGFSFV